MYTWYLIVHLILPVGHTVEWTSIYNSQIQCDLAMEQVSEILPPNDGVLEGAEILMYCVQGDDSKVRA